MISLLGWLDRAGRHYPAAFMDHFKVAAEVCNKNDWQLEEEGFVKIYINNWDKYKIRNRRGTDEVYYIQTPNRLSKEQVDWLVENNFKVAEEDMPL